LTVTAFAEVTLQVRDLERTARFYRRAFQLETILEEGDRIWLSVGDCARLGLWRPGKKEFGDEGGVHVHLAFTVVPGSLDVLAERLRLDKVPWKGPVEHDGGDRSLYVRDPEGNVIEAWDFFARGQTTADL
jgi:catechol-2,3-dioxygenase